VIDIRRVEPDDWQQLRDFRLLSLRDAPSAFGSTYERERGFDEALWRERASSGATFFAVDGAVVVGLSAGIRNGGCEPGERLLVSVYVVPTVRGSGVLDRLVAAVAGWARADGASILRLDVGVDNPRARHAYERCGFRATGETCRLERDPSIVEETMKLGLLE
jgi:GNAT superfamily N-acetyltransferase